MTLLSNSILNTTKTLLGIADLDSSFDQELIVLINGVLNHAYQIGCVEEPVVIQNELNTWDEVISEEKFEELKTYIYLKVRMIFDPPTSSAVLQAYQQMAQESEWRLYAEKENDKWIAEKESQTE